ALLSLCDDGVDFGGNCSVLSCKENLTCKKDLITGIPTCTTE
ncbi:1196_t:CDS:1, partial [Scutellospora calospora]